MEMAFFVIINELLRDKVIAITDTNSNNSLADNLNCVL